MSPAKSHGSSIFSFVESDTDIVGHSQSDDDYPALTSAVSKSKRSKGDTSGDTTVLSFNHTNNGMGDSVVPPVKRDECYSLSEDEDDDPKTMDIKRLKSELT